MNICSMQQKSIHDKETTLPPIFPIYLVLSSVYIGLAAVTKAPEAFTHDHMSAY